MFDSFCYYTGWNEAANQRTYAAPADPWQVIWVDPRSVEFYTLVSMQWGMGRIDGDDWDLPDTRRRVDDLRIHEGLTQRFEEGRDWAETVYYEWAEDELASKDQFRGCSTIDGVLDERCPTVDGIYEEMRTEGYRPNFETVYDDPENAGSVHDLEPIVLVGRNGEILWTEGFHRLTLAALAGIDQIPVYVLVRHDHWQAIRDELATTPPGDRPPELTQFDDHPDLQDVEV